MIKINKSPYLETIKLLMVNAESFIAMGMTRRGIQSPAGEGSARNIVERPLRDSHGKLYELKGICVGSRVYFDR
jgi:hypothetical protein